MSLNVGIDHATCIATVRSSKSRAVRAHYLNLAAYWRIAEAAHAGTTAWKLWRRNFPQAAAAVTTTFTQGVTGQLPA